MSYTYTHKYDIASNMWRDEDTGELSEQCPDEGVVSNSDWNKYMIHRNSRTDVVEEVV